MSFNNLLNQILGTVQKGSQFISNSPLNSFTNDALAAGLASTLMKRKNTQKLVKAGPVTVLGYIAYKGYQNWQQSRSQPELPQQMFEPAGRLAETRSHVILHTMIAAAASDGLVDRAEKQVIARENGTDAETATWPATEYEKPAAVEKLTATVDNDEALAAEIYLATGLVRADLSRKEIVFLTYLSQALGSDDWLVEDLGKQPDSA